MAESSTLKSAEPICEVQELWLGYDKLRLPLLKSKQLTHLASTRGQLESSEKISML